MGYYSDVAFATRQATYEEMLKEAKNDADILDFITVHANVSCVRADDGYDAIVILYWGGIKWYDDFKTVEFIEEWMRRGDCEEDGVEYSFVRIGEDLNDTDIRNSPDYSLDGYIYPTRSIVIDERAVEYSPEIPDDEELPEAGGADEEDMRGFLFGG